MALFLVATNLPVYYLAGGLLGLSASSIVAAMKVIVSRLININQGIAIGIVLAGTSAGQFVMPLFWSHFLEAGFNWRTIFACLSLGSFLISTPLWVIFMARKGDTQDTINASSIGHSEGLTMWAHFKEVCKEKGFWMLATSIFLVSAVDQAMMQNYVSFLRLDRGLNYRDFAWLVTLVTVLAIGGKVFSGWIYDRFSIAGIRVFYFLLGVSVALALPVAGIVTLTVFLVVRNIAHGGMIVEAPVITKHYLGPRNLGMTIGIVSVCVNLGFAAGPPILGWLYDINGNYTMGFVIYSGVALLACALLLPLKPRYWTPPGKRKQEQEVGAAGLQPSGI
jgi:MFS family permease